MSYGQGDYAPEDTMQAAEAPLREKMMRDAKQARMTDGMPPVERALTRCDDAATRILEQAENLHTRLLPVLGPERPEPGLGEVRQADDYSPLAGRLEALADRLEDAVAQLLRTVRRVEL